MCDGRAAGLLALALFVSAAYAQTAKDYPNRPVRIIVPQAAGSGVDLTARVVAQKLTDAWGQQVVVDNRPGANGIIGLEAGAKAKPDGYTLALGVPSSLTMNPYVYKSLPYDTLRDFVPITQTASNTFGLVINPALPVRNVKDLVALARARPGELSYGSFGIGNQTHLGGELFSTQIGIRLLHVPYKGETPAVVDLLSGQIAMHVADQGLPVFFVSLEMELIEIAARLVSARGEISVGEDRVARVQDERLQRLQDDLPASGAADVAGRIDQAHHAEDLQALPRVLLFLVPQRSAGPGIQEVDRDRFDLQFPQ